MSILVLYQKQILSGVDQEPARTVTVFKLQADALEEALKAVRWNYTPWAIAFKELPPEKLLMRACEEAIREGRGQKLPLANPPKKRGSIAMRIVNGLVSP